jgi:hypothetical protein
LFSPNSGTANGALAELVASSLGATEPAKWISIVNAGGRLELFEAKWTELPDLADTVNAK